MRAWKQSEAELERVGGKLLVLSSDPLPSLEILARQRALTSLDLAHAGPEDWVAFGIANPDRPELPHPTTLVIAPDGAEIFRSVHDNFRQRSDPSQAIAAVVDWSEGRVRTTPKPPAPPSLPDWEAAASISLARDGDQLILEAVIAPGFHLYGSKETESIPVYLRTQGGQRAEVPPGVRKDWSQGTSWVLEDTVRLQLQIPADQPVVGSVGWQLCTDQTCSAPRNETFSLAPEEGRVIR